MRRRRLALTSTKDLFEDMLLRALRTSSVSIPVCTGSREWGALVCPEFQPIRLHRGVSAPQSFRELPPNDADNVAQHSAGVHNSPSTRLHHGFSGPRTGCFTPSFLSITSRSP